MGLKHLVAAEKIFRDYPEKSYTKTDIRNILKMNYNYVTDVLSYLISHNVIEEIDKKYKLR